MRIRFLRDAVHLARAAAAALALAACGGSVPDGVRYHGLVEVQEVLVASRLGGRVEETPVPEGSPLAAGTVVARFEAHEAEARVARARAALAAAEAGLLAARNGPRPAELAAAGAAAAAARARLALLRAGPRREEVDAAEADAAAAEAALAQAVLEADRVERLAAAGALPRDAADASRAARDGARAALAAARARARVVALGPREEEIAAAAAEAERADAAERLLAEGTRPEEIARAEAGVAAARAGVEEAEAALRERTVTAPSPCVLEVLAVRRGDVLAPGAPVARLALREELRVRVFVPEPSLGGIAPGRRAEVRLDGSGDRVFAGTVQQVATQPEYTPRNVQSADQRRHQVFGVRVRVDDPGGFLRAGMAAEVRFLPDDGAR